MKTGMKSSMPRDLRKQGVGWRPLWEEHDMGKAAEIEVQVRDWLPPRSSESNLPFRLLVACMQLSSKGIYYGSLDRVLKRIIANDPEHFSSLTRSRKLLSTTSGDIGNPVRTLEKQRARNRKTIPLLRLLTPRFKQNDPKEQWVFFISEQSPFLDDAWAIARNVSKKEAGGRGRNTNKHADDHDLQLNRQV